MDSVQLTNIRAFEDTGAVSLANVNLLVGENNAGKSTVLRSLSALQAGSQIGSRDLRVGATSGSITVHVSDIADGSSWAQATGRPAAQLMFRLHRSSGAVEATILDRSNQYVAASTLADKAPDHFIVPFLSGRKTPHFQEEVRAAHARTVQPTFAYLGARLAMLSNPTHYAHQTYKASCEEILGFPLFSVPSENGMRPGVLIDNDTIWIDQLGEGVQHIVALLADLALSKGKLFLIEEPESDLHPRALKALLDLILQASATNQFIISTHSNIVVRHLGSSPGCNLFKVAMQKGGWPPRSLITRIPSTAEARMEVLRELGYTFTDFELWEGWLILEESSAERIVRDYLIPWFAPKLTRVRVVAAQGRDNVEPTFQEFHRMVLFTHLEAAYKNKTWVRIDNDGQGQQIVLRLQQAYGTWHPDRFGTFTQDQFERYYPLSFSERVEQVLAVADRQERRAAKKLLLDDVRMWLDADEARGRAALAESAQPVIAELRDIERQLVG